MLGTLSGPGMPQALPLRERRRGRSWRKPGTNRFRCSGAISETAICSGRTARGSLDCRAVLGTPVEITVRFGVHGRDASLGGNLENDLRKDLSSKPGGALSIVR